MQPAVRSSLDLMVPWNAVTTATKIRTARVLYRMAMGVRAIRRTSGPLIVNRRGLRFELDLAEGIDLSIFFLGVFEPQTVRALATLAPTGGVVLDIGANIGFHTLHLARAVGPTGHVFAFEPTDYAQRKLRRNLSLNPALAQRVTVLRAYLDGGDGPSQPAQDRFYSSWRLDSAANQHPKHFGSMKGATHARRLRLDDFLQEQHLDRVDLVKLDVDGFECRVLKGATQLLDRLGPTFVTELCPYALEEHGGSATEMLASFAVHGYCLYDERNLAPLPSSAAELERLIRRNSSINIVAAKSR